MSAAGVVQFVRADQHIFVFLDLIAHRDFVSRYDFFIVRTIKLLMDTVPAFLVYLMKRDVRGPSGGMQPYWNTDQAEPFMRPRQCRGRCVNLPPSYGPRLIFRRKQVHGRAVPYSVQDVSSTGVPVPYSST
jgi:hypothetical protein